MQGGCKIYSFLILFKGVSKLAKKWVDIDRVIESNSKKDINKEIDKLMKSIPKGEKAK